MSTWTINMQPNVIFGVDSRKQLGKKLLEYGTTKAILVCDPAMVEFGFADELAGILKADGIESVPCQIELGEPDSDKVDKVYAVAKENQVNGVVGLGGGTAMDTAKFVGLLLANGGKASEYLGYATTKKVKTFQPIITMPTTSGTGAEVNVGLVCDDLVTKRKSAAWQSATCAIVDPVYTTGLPASVTATTGCDALAHLMETLSNTENAESWIADLLAYEGIRAGFQWLPVACRDGKNLEARANMSWVALLGGYALKHRKTSLGHVFTNEISNTFHLPHGNGVSATLYAVTRYIALGCPKAARIVARAIDIPCPEGADMNEVGRQIVEKFDAMLKGIGIKTLSELGIDEVFIDKSLVTMKTDGRWKVVPYHPDWEVSRKALLDALKL